MATFNQLLSRFFSNKIILKRSGKGSVRTIDFNKLQSMGNQTMMGQKYKWKSGKRFVMSGYGFGTTSQQLQVNRQTLYTDYENMDTDAYISAALDIYADECTVKNVNGDILLIKTDNEDIKRILYNLFYDTLNIEFNLWHWIRTMCKYGDFFLNLQIKEELGVIDVIPIHPLFVERDEYNPDTNLKFIYNGEGYNTLGKNEFEPYEIAHFRHLADQNYLPYGKSLLEGARRVFKQLQLMEDAMLLHRIMRAPERRIFKIDVGGIAPEQVDQYMDDIANQIKKVPYVDESTGEYNLKFNLMNMMEDFYLPTRGGESGTSIESLPGLSSEGQIEDIEYIRNKMLAYLKIPKAYLGFDQEGGGEGKATLAAEDIRFARTIERIQKIFTDELYKIAVIHLYVQGFDKEDLLNFELQLTNPSLIYKRQQVDLMNEQVNLIGNIIDKKLFSKKYIYENIFGLTQQEWEADQERVIEDLKREFREEQIKSEGNDPALTGESYGTPHDLLTLQMASQVSPKQTKKMYEQEDGRHENEGRPVKHGSFERHKDPAYGRDPVGKKEMDRIVSAEAIISGFKRNSLKKTLNENKQEDNHLKMLNEDNILLEQ